MEGYWFITRHYNKGQFFYAQVIAKFKVNMVQHRQQMAMLNNAGEVDEAGKAGDGNTCMVDVAAKTTRAVK